MSIESSDHLDARCPRCGYDLRGFIETWECECSLEGCCSECGLEFDWRTVLDAAAWRSDFLFEHHWQRRPIRSWFKTVLRSCRPIRFWSQVSIHDTIQPKPLLFMVFSAVSVFVIVFHGVAYAAAVLFSQLDTWLFPLSRGRWSPSTLGWWSQDLDAIVRSVRTPAGCE